MGQWRQAAKCLQELDSNSDFSNGSHEVLGDSLGLSAPVSSLTL